MKMFERKDSRGEKRREEAQRDTKERYTGERIDARKKGEW